MPADLERKAWAPSALACCATCTFTIPDWTITRLSGQRSRIVVKSCRYEGVRVAVVFFRNHKNWLLSLVRLFVGVKRKCDGGAMQPQVCRNTAGARGTSTGSLAMFSEPVARFRSPRRPASERNRSFRWTVKAMVLPS